MSFTRRAAATLIAACALLPAPLLAQATTDYDKIVEAKTVRAGAVEASPWYERDLVTGEWTGLVPDILDAIFTPKGIAVEYVETQWGTAVAGLQSGRFDLMGAYNETPERAQAIDFTKPIGGLRLSILMLTGEAADYENWDKVDADARRLAVIDGSGAARIMPPRLTHAQWTAVPSSDTMFLELESGRVDAIVTSDAQIADYLSSRGRGTMVIPQPVEALPTNIGLRKAEDPALRDWLNAELDRLAADGSLEKIWAKYTTPHAD